jgi:eukaryotic-like serine/threonine-protein kinase
MRELGSGGMATVYLAEDVKHRRNVAIKVLHPELSAVLGPDRFLKEIELTAGLQHPHILPLFDSGNADGLLYYVMPYVEGETLRGRLEREQQLPVADALRIATDVADALEYAHKRGVVHRDVKPENILLHDGRPLVADFGIALAVQQAGGSRMTQTGMSLGTPQYMSPEQAMGDRNVDHRADIYALGAVTYEMLAGEPPFTGPNSQAVVAKVLTTDPTSLVVKRRSVPQHVADAVLTALEKMPADRFGTAAQFSEAMAGHGASLVPTRPATPGLPDAPAAVRWKAAYRVAAGAATLALMLATWVVSRSMNAGDSRPHWQYIALHDSLDITLDFPALALSPDGDMIAFRDDIPSTPIWIRNRAELNARTMPGTERAQHPAFSPDGGWIAFIADGRLKKVRVTGGGAVTLADSATAENYGGLTWLDDGKIVYVSPSQYELRRVSSSGGSYSVAMLDTGLAGRGIGNPSALPGSRGVLFSLCSSGCVTSSLHVTEFGTDTQRLLVDDAVQGWYLPTGHILYVRRDGVALVAPFDLRSFEITGGPVSVLDNVAGAPGFAQLAWTPAGTVVYVSGGTQSRNNTIVRLTREGLATPVDTSWAGQFNSLALSPDGRRLAVGVGRGSSALNVWIKQLDRGPLTRLTFGGRDRRPAWSPDGRQVAFVRDTLTTGIVIVRPADGTGSDRQLVHLPQQVQGLTWSRDGAWVVVRTDNAGPGAGDLIGIRTNGDSTPVALVASPFTELHPDVSRDGRWIAYTSNESGRDEVYVRPFPATNGGLFQVSTGGGAQPAWSPDGSELFFLDPQNRMVAAQIRTTPAFEVTALRPLFSARGFVLDAFQRGYEVTPDGQFLFVSPQNLTESRSLRVVRVDNWLRDLRGRVAQ